MIPREARFHFVLRQDRAAARRIFVLDPGQGSAVLHLSGSVRRGRTWRRCGPALNFSTPPCHPGRSEAESRDLHPEKTEPAGQRSRVEPGMTERLRRRRDGRRRRPAGKTLPPLILRSRPAWVCVSKDEGGAGPDGSPCWNPSSFETRCAAASLLRMRGGVFLMLTIFLCLPSCVHSSPKRGRFRSGLWRGGEAAPAPVEYRSAVPGGLLKAAERKGRQTPCVRL